MTGGGPNIGGNMSVSEDRTSVAPAATAASPIADPAPLGLAAFALTTFLLSAANAHWMNGNATGNAWLGYAFAYGGLCQLLAGMWEFRNRNVFGATAFSSYGGFWIGLGLWVLLVADRTRPAVAAGTAFLNTRPGVDPARVRDLQHLHAALQHPGEHGGLRRVPDP